MASAQALHESVTLQMKQIGGLLEDTRKRLKDEQPTPSFGAQAIPVPALEAPKKGQAAAQEDGGGVQKGAQQMPPFPSPQVQKPAPPAASVLPVPAPPSHLQQHKDREAGAGDFRMEGTIEEDQSLTLAVDRSLVSVWSMAWLIPMVWKGNKRPITEEEVPGLLKTLRTRLNFDLATEEWAKLVAKGQAEKPGELLRVMVRIYRFSFYLGAVIGVIHGLIITICRPMALKVTVDMLTDLILQSTEEGNEEDSSTGPPILQTVLMILFLVFTVMFEGWFFRHQTKCSG